MSGLTQVIEMFQTGGGGGGGGNVMGTGAAGQVAFWTGLNTIAGDNNAFWDNTNKRLGLAQTVPLSTLHNNGSFSNQKQTIQAADYVVLLTDNYIGLVPAPPVAIKITLPTVASAGQGKTYIIKDEVGFCDPINTLTISAQPGETIDMSLTQVFITAFTSVTVRCNGPRWHII
jgi:hypothetical protein